MLDIIGFLTFPVIAFISWRTLIRATTTEAQTRRRATIVVVAWFALIATLAGLGAYARPNGFIGIGASVVLPVIVGIIAAAKVPSLRAAALGIPIATLIALNIGRLLGVYFLMLESAGRLPHTFAHTAGWGDIAVGLLAIPVALAAHRRIAGWPGIVLGWNTLAIGDLITAVTLGFGSGETPLRFIHEAPSTAAIATLPWTLIPAFLVPTYFLTHLAIYAQLKRAWSPVQSATTARARA
jgi:hypothetical protein